MSKVKITVKKPAERKIVGWRSKGNPDYVYLLDGSYDPIYEGEFSVTFTP